MKLKFISGDPGKVRCACVAGFKPAAFIFQGDFSTDWASPAAMTLNVSASFKKILHNPLFQKTPIYDPENQTEINYLLNPSFALVFLIQQPTIIIILSQKKQPLT